MTPIQQMLLGVGGATNTYVDEVFSQYLYTGNDTDNRDIVNGIDLAGEGGAVWSFVRNQSGRDNTSYDTERGTFKMLKIQAQDSEFDYTPHNGGIKQWNSNGFRLESGGGNDSGEEYNTYTFRKAEKFFDIVTYTGNGSNRTISHSLNSVPGMIIIKKRNAGSTAWMVYHRSVGNTKYMKLNSTDEVDVDDNTVWNDTTPTSSVFSVGTHTGVNANNDTYVAYLFAHDESEFGVNGDASIIKCGTYTGNDQSGANANDVDLGFEPQFVLIVNKSRTYENWVWHNSATNLPGTDINSTYHTTSASAEVTNETRLMVTPRGFSPTYGTGHLANDWNNNGDEYIYMAIRCVDGVVGKPIETGTDALTMTAGTSGAPLFPSPNHIVDFALQKSSYQSGTADWSVATRLNMGYRIEPNTTAAAASNSYQIGDFPDGWSSYTGGDGSRFGWLFKRHAGFDMVVQEITTEAGYPYYKHSLGVVPEMIWSKRLDAISDWTVYHKGLNGGTNPENWRVRLNENAAQYEDTYVWGLGEGPSSTQFQTKGASFAIGSHIFLLFASVEGVSKIGYYSGSNSSQTISTGFAPRFLVMKKVDTTQGWVVLDTVRGWGSGDDERLEFHNDSAQNDSIDFGAPTSSGFTLVGNVEKSNQSGGSYIYYAHA